MNKRQKIHTLETRIKIVELKMKAGQWLDKEAELAKDKEALKKLKEA